VALADFVLLVAILGIGGLGIQFAAKMGFESVAVRRGKDKEELAKKWR
jgi:D-arabinose 1-dehydrogenase-like Zn-dependent alcohol dehydrogenase